MEPAKPIQIPRTRGECGADDSVCAWLEQLPGEDFQAPAEVSQAFNGPSTDNAGPGRQGKQRSE